MSAGPNLYLVTGAALPQDTKIPIIFLRRALLLARREEQIKLYCVLG